MIDLRECEPLAVMPLALREDLKIQAASYALRVTAKMLMDKIDQASVYAGIDLLPENILDLLAEESRAQYYDTSLPVEDKRKAVKKSLLWYCKAGTVSAVKELTDLVWRSDAVRVQEWFSYESDPYLFRILLGTDMQIEEERINVFLDAVWKVKNTRSHLESITFMREIKNPLYVGTGTSRTNRIIITDVWKDEYEMRTGIYSAPVPAMVQRIQIREG